MPHEPPSLASHRTVEAAARRSYAKIVSIIATQSGDLDLAEDAVGDALHAALTTWPRDGVPDNPDAWLLAVARRKRIDAWRRARVRPMDPSALSALESIPDPDLAALPDERLRMLFVCAHPSIDPGVRSALMLRCVLGLSADAIAQRFLVSKSAMVKRLTRAKSKIRSAGIRFEVPAEDDLPARTTSVLEAVYASFGVLHDAPNTPDPADATEPLSLAAHIAERLPREPEAFGLWALMAYCHARRETRRSRTGAFVPLDEQDHARWDQGLIDRADDALRYAARWGRPGRFQLEAAIQSAHVERLRAGAPGWSRVVELYAMLRIVSPTIGAVIGHAAALGQASGPDAGLQELDRLDPDRVAEHQPYHAVRAALLRRAGRFEEADQATRIAAGLTPDPAVRSHLLGQIGAR